MPKYLSKPKLGDLVYRTGSPHRAGKIIQLGLTAPTRHSQLPQLTAPAVRVKLRTGEEELWTIPSLLDFRELVEESAKTLTSHQKLLEKLESL